MGSREEQRVVGVGTGQQGGMACDLEGWCPHSFAGDNASGPGTHLGGKSAFPASCPLSGAASMALLLVGQGVQERERELAYLLGPARLFPLLYR